MAFAKNLDPTVPASTDNANALDTFITDFKVAVNERMALEHQDLSTGSSTDTADTAQGRHIPGKVSAVYCATAAQIAAYTTGVHKGAVAYGTDTQKLYIYDGASWTTYTLSPPTPYSTGMILMYMGTVAPTGWLICNGAAITPGSYPALEAFLLAQGLSATVLPDMRQRFPYGSSVSPSFPVGSTTPKTSTTVSHTHSFTTSLFVASTTYASVTSIQNASITYPTIAVNFIIKT